MPSRPKSELSETLPMPFMIEKKTSGAIIKFSACKKIVRTLPDMYSSMKVTVSALNVSFRKKPTITPATIAIIVRRTCELLAL